MITDYQIALIIITIIGFIITTAFYIYFVYLPAARAEAKIDIINQEGEDLITLVNQRVIDVQNATVETLQSICVSIQELICQYNANNITGCPVPPTGPRCILTPEAYPAYCTQFAPFDPTCTCSPT